MNPLKQLRRFFRCLRHRKLGKRGEMEVFIGGSIGIVLSVFMIRSCEKDDKQRIENRNACEMKCRPHPVKATNPCICIINEEIRT